MTKIICLILFNLGVFYYQIDKYLDGSEKNFYDKYNIPRKPAGEYDVDQIKQEVKKSFKFGAITWQEHEVFILQAKMLSNKARQDFYEITNKHYNSTDNSASDSQIYNETIINGLTQTTMFYLMSFLILNLMMDNTQIETIKCLSFL